MFIKYTNVDAVTGISSHSAPMVNGPAMPNLPGLKFDFALESQWPTTTPEYYGWCDDNVPANSQGILEVLTKPDYDAAKDNEMKLRVSVAKKLVFANLAAKRSAVEGGGITLRQMGGVDLAIPVVIQTAKEDQDRIDTCLNNMERYPDILPKISFKAANNNWVELDYASMKLIGGLVVKHVQDCFNAEKTHTDAINALTSVETVRVYDITTGWPPN